MTTMQQLCCLLFEQEVFPY